MRQISSTWTWWHKKAFPAIWFGFLALITALFIPDILAQEKPVSILWIPLGMAIFGYVVCRWMVFPFVDEVWLDGKDVLVRNGNGEDRFPITNIQNVDVPMLINPERIVLKLRQPCCFGSKIVFSPSHRHPWRRSDRHPIVEELIRRAKSLD